MITVSNFMPKLSTNVTLWENFQPVLVLVLVIQHLTRFVSLFLVIQVVLTSLDDKMCREVTNPASDDIHALIQLLHIRKSAAFPNKFMGLRPYLYMYMYTYICICMHT